MGVRKKAGETSHDEIGFWSEIKLDILKKYWPKYTAIIKNQRWNFKTIYIDGFAGSGKHVSRETGEFVAGSPARALDVEPPFDEYHFIDLDEGKARSLEELARRRKTVTVHSGDCNSILIRDVFPRARYEDYCRAVCLLDPYSLQLDWQVMEHAGGMKSIEVFLNFPIMDINRSVLQKSPTQKKLHQMTRFWGDESWRDVAYHRTEGLFGPMPDEKVENWELVNAFRERLKSRGKFAFVPEPIAMRNRTRSAIYYLFFAGNNETGAKIVKDIFNGYREQGYG